MHFLSALAGLLVLTVPLLAQTPLTSQLVADGLDLPVYVTAPRTDFERVFIVELGGKIKILRGATVLATPFLDLSDVIQTSPGFEGVFGMAFHPQYASNGFFYVSYAGQENDVVLARYQVSSEPQIADPDSEQVVLRVPTPLDGHEGGAPFFGPDGYLYLALGDGEPQNDVNCNGQNPELLLGKLLRLDVDGDDFPGEPLLNYSIPPDNPFVGNAAVADEIWAIGLRNPWRSSFDRVSGELFIGDNGQNLMEEIDVEPSDSLGGRNYGWPVMEGSLCFPNACAPGTPLCNQPELTLPFLEYGHPSGCSVIGGYVYRGVAMPELRGTYFYADFCGSSAGGGIFSFRMVQGAIADHQDRSVELAPGDGLEISFQCSWGEDAAGELYMVDHYGGEVFKLVEDEPFLGAFVDLGPFGVPGVAGEPILEGGGDLTPGSAVGYRISCVGAAPFALGFAFFGTTVNPTPFYGGIFYPFPFLGSGMFAFDEAGELSISTAFPASTPGGISVVQQFFFLDAAALYGVSGSNGLRLDLP